MLQASCQRLQQTVRTILSEVNPSHVVAVFDGDSPSWRHQLYPAYKAGRSPMPPELANGMEQLQDSLWQCGVDSLLSEGDEADDLVATLRAGATAGLLSAAQHDAPAAVNERLHLIHPRRSRGNASRVGGGARPGPSAECAGGVRAEL